MTSRSLASRSLACTVATLAVLGLAAHPAQAQTTVTLSGSYDHGTGNGYDTTDGNSYTVTPTATFYDNDINGLSDGDGDPVTINGGTFSGNEYGILAYDNSSTATTASIYGGTFSSNSFADIVASGRGTSKPATITLYGTFSTYGLLTSPASGGNGTFTGTLQDDAVSQTFTYQDNPADGGSIYLAPADGPVPPASAAPEPSALAVWAFVGLGAAGLVVKARKKKAAPAA